MKDATIFRLTLSHDGRGNRMFNTSYNMVGGIIPEDYQLRIKKLFDESKDNKLTDNSTTYITPLSELPAYKLKNYIQENKLKITTTRKFEKLDTLVLNKDFIERHYFNITTWNEAMEHLHRSLFCGLKQGTPSVRIIFAFRNSICGQQTLGHRHTSTCCM